MCTLADGEFDRVFLVGFASAMIPFVEFESYLRLTTSVSGIQGTIPTRRTQ